MIPANITPQFIELPFVHRTVKQETIEKMKKIIEEYKLTLVE